MDIRKNRDYFPIGLHQQMTDFMTTFERLAHIRDKIYNDASNAAFFFPVARQPLGGLGCLIFRGFTITLFRHTALCRTPLDEGPARRRDLYLTTHNNHKIQTSMP
jgi:hypothetical protein